MSEISADSVLRPIQTTSWKAKTLFGVFLIFSVLFIFGWIFQIREGLVITDLADPGRSGGVPWGLYIGAFLFWGGIAYGALGISAVIRVFKLETYRPLARISEVLAISAMLMAAVSILVSLGRPDRVLNVLLYFPSRVAESPLQWDVAVIVVFLGVAVTYLILALRQDIYAVRDRLPSWLGWLYSILLIGYSPAEDEKADRMVWWLGVGILGFVVLVGGGIVPWLFSLVGAQFGWFGGLAGPAMLVESVAAAVGVLIVVAGVFRYAYDWKFLDETVFRGLALTLVILSLGILWLLLHELLPGLLAGSIPAETIATASTEASGFLLSVIALGLVLIYLIAGLLRDGLFNIFGAVVAGVVIAGVVFYKKLHFIVEGLLHGPVFPLYQIYPPAEYMPTVPELLIVASMFAIPGLLFIIAAKVIPLVDLNRLEVEQ